MMKVKVFGKLNLSLNVYEKQGAFHPIDSVVTSVDIFDTVTVTLRKDDSIFVLCDSGDIPTLQNSAYLAALEFQKEFHTCGCNIGVVKGIPVGAGMGGSSADAAAVIYCLCKLCAVDVDCDRVKAICARLGSDVNYMLLGGLARMTGKGDDVEPFALYKPLYFVLTTFYTPMNTGEVYKAFDGMQKSADGYCDNRRLLATLTSSVCAQQDFRFVKKKPVMKFSNMLEPAVTSLSDYASEYLQFCDERNIPTTMTGSGSAFYVACRNKSEATVISKLLVSKGFNTRVCRSVSRGIKKVIF